MAVDVALAATRALLKEQVGSGRTQAMLDEAIAELPRRLRWLSENRDRPQKTQERPPPQTGEGELCSSFASPFRWRRWRRLRRRRGS